MQDLLAFFRHTLGLAGTAALYDSLSDREMVAATPRVALAWLRVVLGSGKSEYDGCLPGTDVPVHVTLSRSGQVWGWVGAHPRTISGRLPVAAAAVAAELGADPGDSEMSSRDLARLDGTIEALLRVADPAEAEVPAIARPTPPVIDEVSRAPSVAVHAAVRSLKVHVLALAAARACAACGQTQLSVDADPSKPVPGDLIGCACVRGILSTARVSVEAGGWIVKPSRAWGGDAAAVLAEVLS